MIGLMTGGHVSFASGYAQVVANLARQSLAVAVDSAPHRAREGEQRWPMALALPAVRFLIGEPSTQDDADLVNAADQLKRALLRPPAKVTDGFGHARPIYAWFALHLLGSAARLAHNAEAMDYVGQAAGLMLAGEESDRAADSRLAVWRGLVAWQQGLVTESAVSQSRLGGEQPIVPLGLNDLIDAWTYNELVGVHGLHLQAVLRGDAQAEASMRSATLYHLGHTQPDYTTYQPWALAAFATDARTAVFAEQQLHDVATHLSIEGPGGAVLPALLLAEASATLAGTLARAWATV